MRKVKIRGAMRSQSSPSNVSLYDLSLHQFLKIVLNKQLFSNHNVILSFQNGKIHRTENANTNVFEYSKGQCKA